MELHQLIAQLRRAADDLESVSNRTEAQPARAGDVAQIRRGHPAHPGRLVLLHRTTEKGIRATLLEAHKSGVWGTDLTLNQDQLDYVGTPASQATAAALTNSERRNAALAIVRDAPATLPERKPATRQLREPASRAPQQHNGTDA